MSYEFKPYGKTPRFGNLFCTITEKIDGTNAQIIINGEDDRGPASILACSRNRVLCRIQVLAEGRSDMVPTVDRKGWDNYGFGGWVYENFEQLLRLGPGAHQGEWAGLGVARGYSKARKSLVLFDADRYERSHPGNLPEGVELAPVLYRGPLSTESIDTVVSDLRQHGSRWAPGFLHPEGAVVRFQNTVAKIVIDK